MSKISSFNPEGDAQLGLGYGLITDMLVSISVWSLLQVVIFQWPDLSAFNLKHDVNVDVRNRMVSIVHGIVSLCVCTYLTMTSSATCGSQIIQSEYGAGIMTLGYFTYDFLCMAWFGLLERDMIIHHFLSITGMTVVFYTGVNMYTLVWGTAIAEVSNPFLHLRTIFKYLGYRYARSYEVAELTFFFTFFVARMPVGHYFMYMDGLTCEHYHIVGKALFAGLLLQSYQFVMSMYKILMRRFAEIKERNDKKIKIGWFTPISQKDLETCKFYQSSKKHSKQTYID